MSIAVVDCAVEIRRSAEDVYDYVTDISREFEWNPRTRRVVKLTDGPVGVGTRWEGQWIAGDPMLIDYVAFDRPKSWCSRSTPWRRAGGGWRGGGQEFVLADEFAAQNPIEVRDGNLDPVGGRLPDLVENA